MSTETLVATQGGGKVKAYLQLFRLPNVFTAMADIFLGFLFTHAVLEPSGVFLLLLAASSLIYTAGMVLNDVYDVEIDRRDRPMRPLPSGAISVGWGRWLGFELLLVGVGCAWLAGYFAGTWRSGLVATGLALVVWGYDRHLKCTPLGPVAMGGCRFLNVLLGMSAATFALETMHLVVAAGVGIYIVGVTWFARTEAHVSGRPHLAGGTLVMGAGLALLASIPRWSSATLPLVSQPLAAEAQGERWYLLWALLAALIGWRCLWAVMEPVPLRVQAAVKQAILSLIVLDAAACFAVRGQFWAVMILLLLLPTMALGRWIYST